MPVYAWEGRNRQGALKKGVIEASSEAAATLRLRGQMISPTSVRPKASKGFGDIKLFQKARLDRQCRRSPERLLQRGRSQLTLKPLN